MLTFAQEALCPTVAKATAQSVSIELRGEVLDTILGYGVGTVTVESRSISNIGSFAFATISYDEMKLTQTFFGLSTLLTDHIGINFYLHQIVMEGKIHLKGEESGFPLDFSKRTASSGLLGYIGLTLKF